MLKLDESYGPEPQHTYDLCDVGSSKLLVLIHGGGWTHGDKNAPNLVGWRQFAQDFNINVATINYTLATKDMPTAALTKDSPPRNRPTHNIQFAAKHIAELTGSDRVTLLGTSAGANLAALTWSFYPNVIDGFIGYYGAYDLTQLLDFSSEVIKRIKVYSGGDINKQSGSSPEFTDIPNKKFIMYHGELDTTVKAQQSRAMDYENIRSELELYPYKKHAFNIFDIPAEDMLANVKYINTGD